MKTLRKCMSLLMATLFFSFTLLFSSCAFNGDEEILKEFEEATTDDNDSVVKV